MVHVPCAQSGCAWLIGIVNTNTRFVANWTSILHEETWVRHFRLLILLELNDHRVAFLLWHIFKGGAVSPCFVNMPPVGPRPQALLAFNFTCSGRVWYQKLHDLRHKGIMPHRQNVWNWSFSGLPVHSWHLFYAYLGSKMMAFVHLKILYTIIKPYLSPVMNGSTLNLADLLATYAQFSLRPPFIWMI